MNKELLITYKNKSELLAKKKLQLASVKLKFEEKFKDLIDGIKLDVEELDVLKESLKQEAEIDYKLTGDKKFSSGISVRVGKTFIYEEDKAFNWAKEHGVSLKLDTKSFEKYAKVEQPDFVEIKDKLTVCFPKELIVEDVDVE